MAQADQKTNDVVFLGDSITYYWGTATRPDPGSAVFSAYFSPLGAANFGMYGDTSQNLLYRVETGDLNGHPRVAVVMIGFNDLYGGSTPQQTAAGVMDVVRAIQFESPGTKLLLLGILPNEVSFLYPEIQKVNSMLAKSAGQAKVDFLNPGVKFDVVNRAANPAFLMDLVHPNAAGYLVLAKAIDGTILDLLGRRR